MAGDLSIIPVFFFRKGGGLNKILSKYRELGAYKSEYGICRFLQGTLARENTVLTYEIVEMNTLGL